MSWSVSRAMKCPRASFAQPRRTQGQAQGAGVRSHRRKAPSSPHARSPRQPAADAPPPRPRYPARIQHAECCARCNLLQTNAATGLPPPLLPMPLPRCRIGPGRMGRMLIEAVHVRRLTVLAGALDRAFQPGHRLDATAFLGVAAAYPSPATRARAAERRGADRLHPP